MSGPIWKQRLRTYLGPCLAVLLFVLAVRMLIDEAAEITWQQFRDALLAIPIVYLVIAALLIALNYCLLITYDLLALQYLRQSLPLRRVALVAFLGYSLGNNLGTLVAAAPVRFHFYSRWGLGAGQIVALLAFGGLTFWSGVWLLGGTTLTFAPIPLPTDVLQIPFTSRALGVSLLVIWCGYAFTCAVWHRPIPIGGMRLRSPPLGLMILQSSVAAVDLTVTSTALYLVLPSEATVPFTLVLAAYLTAIAASLITQVPGGLGVLELILLKLLSGAIGTQVLASLLVFRVLYYVIPLLLGMTTLVVHELWYGSSVLRQEKEEPRKSFADPIV